MENESDSSFDERSFWDTMGRVVRRLGSEAIEKVLLAYYVAIDPSTPTWARTALFSALGYFILPIDAVPDALPVVGFGDDIAVLVTALAAVAMYVTEEHIERARAQMRSWGFKLFDSPEDEAA